jgi:hypothetical protein
MSAASKTSKLRTAKRGTHCVQRRVRRIVQTGDDRQINHRADFKHCPNCDHAMENEKWDEAGVTLILEPGCYKAGCVTVISECPKCFELSWIHERMNGFGWNDAWPADWKEAVKKREASVKLEALRQWGAGICHNCRHLTEGNVEYHAWRHCIKGSGAAEKTCDKYTALNSPNIQGQTRSANDAKA